MSAPSPAAQSAPRAVWPSGSGRSSSRPARRATTPPAPSRRRSCATSCASSTRWRRARSATASRSRPCRSCSCSGSRSRPATSRTPRRSRRAASRSTSARWCSPSACCSFEELTGRHPFGAMASGRRFARIQKCELGSGVQYFPQVPSQLRNVLMKAMGPFPEERYRSLKELREHLERFVEGRADETPGKRRAPSAARADAVAGRSGLHARSRSWRRRASCAAPRRRARRAGGAGQGRPGARRLGDARTGDAAPRPRPSPTAPTRSPSLRIGAAHLRRARARGLRRLRRAGGARGRLLRAAPQGAAPSSAMPPAVASQPVATPLGRRATSSRRR